MKNLFSLALLAMLSFAASAQSLPDLDTCAVSVGIEFSEKGERRTVRLEADEALVNSRALEDTFALEVGLPVIEDSQVYPRTFMVWALYEDGVLRWRHRGLDIPSDTTARVLLALGQGSKEWRWVFDGKEATSVPFFSVPFFNAHELTAAPAWLHRFWQWHSDRLAKTQPEPVGAPQDTFDGGQ